MKRSEFEASEEKRLADELLMRDRIVIEQYVHSFVLAAQRAGVIWDPEEPEKPEGFEEWWSGWRTENRWVKDECLAAWNACLAHAKAKPRPEEPQGQWFDGMSFEEIDAHLDTGTFPGAMTPGSWVEVPSGFMTWKARQSRHEAQQRTIETPVDPEVRRKEIEAQIEAWLDWMGWQGTLRVDRGAAARSLLRHVGVL